MQTQLICRRLALSLTGASVLVAVLPALAQADFPNRPIRIVIPLPAGGAADVGVRTMALELEKSLKQPIVVENKPGGLFMLGLQSVLAAPADGYSMMHLNLGMVGVQVVRYKVAIFVMSAVFASLMGSVTAHYVGFVTPNLADFFHSIELVTMVVIGGMASVYGSVLGAVLLTALPQALTSFEGWETVAFGTILMLCMIFLPKGLVPTLAAKFVKGK